MFFYSPSENAFYSASSHSTAGDLIEIADEDHIAMVQQANAQAKRIVPGPDGRPMLEDPPPPLLDERLLWAERRRQVAYRDEADPIYFKTQRGEATMDDWLAKIAEIKARHPDPES